MFNNFMQYAIKNAEKALKNKEIPVGAIIVYENNIIASTYNKTLSNPINHAEILAIKQALRSLKVRHLLNCEIYVTLEPCPMCKYAISLAKIKKIFYGAHNPQYQEFQTNHIPEVYSSIGEIECSNLLKEFFTIKRNKNNKN